MSVNPIFQCDIFVSRYSKDKAVVHAVADGLRVWSAKWELDPDDRIPAKIQEGLEHLCGLVLCMSANASCSDSAHLEADTFRYRDPLNKEYPYAPPAARGCPHQRLSRALSFRQLVGGDPGKEYLKLLETYRPPAKPTTALRLEWTGVEPSSGFVSRSVLCPSLHQLIDRGTGPLRYELIDYETSKTT
jgi:hypothetical protein